MMSELGWRDPDNQIWCLSPKTDEAGTLHYHVTTEMIEGDLIDFGSDTYVYMKSEVYITPPPEAE